MQGLEERRLQGLETLTVTKMEDGGGATGEGCKRRKREELLEHNMYWRSNKTFPV